MNGASLVAPPLRPEHVVHELARIGREESGVVRPFGQPGRRQGREKRLALGDHGEGGRASERHLARGE